MRGLKICAVQRLFEGPGHAGETADGLGSQVLEGTWGEVEVVRGTANAAVDDLDCNGLALVCS